MKCRPYDASWQPWLDVLAVDAETGNVILLDDKGLPVRSHISQLMFTEGVTQGEIRWVPLARSFHAQGVGAFGPVVAIGFSPGAASSDKVLMSNGNVYDNQGIYPYEEKT